MLFIFIPESGFHNPLPPLFPEDRNCDTCVTFPVFPESEAFHISDASQMPLDSVSECAGAFAVDDADAWQVGKVGVVQIFVELRQGLVCGHAKEIDLCGDGQGFAHLHAAGAGSC